MPTGIGASLTTLTNGTTADAPTVMSDLNAINNAGVSNDSGNISTSGSGDITAKSLNTANGVIRGLFFLATPFLLVNAVTINSGVTNTYTATGGSTGVPSGAKAVLVNVAFNTPSAAGGFLQIAPHSGTLGDYVTIGNTSASGNPGACNGGGILPVDASGQIDIKANGQNCLVSLFLYGYLI